MRTALQVARHQFALATGHSASEPDESVIFKMAREVLLRDQEIVDEMGRNVSALADRGSTG